MLKLKDYPEESNLFSRTEILRKQMEGREFQDLLKKSHCRCSVFQDKFYIRCLNYKGGLEATRVFASILNVREFLRRRHLYISRSVIWRNKLEYDRTYRKAD